MSSEHTTDVINSVIDNLSVIVRDDGGETLGT